MEIYRNNGVTFTETPPPSKLNTILGGVAGVLVSRASADHAVNGGGQDRAFKTVAETVYEWNQPQHIEAFMERATINTIALKDDFKLRIAISDAPYSDHHIMVILDHKKYYSNPEIPQAGIVHDEDEEISKNYWLNTLLMAQYFKDQAPQLSFDKIIVVENTCCEVSNESARLPRSIKSVHSQVIGFDSSTLLEVDESQLCPDNLTQERELWRNISGDFVSELNKMTDLQFIGNPYEYPQGYHLNIPFGDCNKISDLADDVNKTLRSHHKAYTSVVCKYSNGQPNEKPQPSYVTLITFDDSKLTITISPVLVSFAGGLDTVGLVTRRVPDAPTIHVNGMEARRQETGKKIKDYLES